MPEIESFAAYFKAPGVNNAAEIQALVSAET